VRGEEEPVSRKSRSQASSSSVVEKLIEQRRLIEEWIAKLGAGGTDAMPPHVIERVRNDYTARLAAVTTELGQHADGVRQSLADAQAHHEELEKEQLARRDELAELRLRRQVGELDEGKFKEQSQKLKAAVDDVTKELTATLRDIDRLEEILDTMGRSDEPAEEPAAVEEEQEEEEVEAAEVEDSAVPEERKPEPAAAAAPPPAPAPSSPPPPPAPPPEKKPPQDELSFLRSVTGVISAQKPPPKPAPPKGAPPSEPVPAGDDGEKPFYTVMPESPETPAEKAERQSKEVQKIPEGERTLSCGECGALNLPTEWYCEKCGAELTNF
jgi:hypothetical protein